MRAWVVTEMQLMIILESTEIGETGGVVEQDAQGELARSRVAFEVRVRSKFALR